MKWATVLHRYNKPPSIAQLDYDRLPILSAEALITALSLNKRLRSIEKISGAGQQYFKALYLPAIVNYAEAVQLAPASAAHHHAGPGGLLAHTLDVIEIALRLRKAYNLPQFSTPETIYEQEHVWSYGVFVGALLHDIGKMVCSTRIRLENQNIWTPHEGSILNTGAKRYKIEFVKAPYKAHTQLSNSFFHLLPEKGRGWLAQYQDVLAQLTTWLYGDLYESGAIGEIVRRADRQSVANNIKNGADQIRFPNSPQVPLVERLITALRELLHDGVLKINRPDGSAGWCDNQFTYLVCGTVSDMVRQRLHSSGATDIPADNSRIFDIWQEHGYALSTSSGGSIWRLTVNGKFSLTVLKFETSRIFHPSFRPKPFEGKLVVVDNISHSAPVNKDTDDGDGTTKQVPMKPMPQTIAEDHNKNFDRDTLPQPEPIAIKPARPTAQNDIDVGTENYKEVSVDNTPVTVAETSSVENILSRSAPNSFTLEDPDIAHYFLDWLRCGLRDGKILVNRRDALVHIVKEGVLIVSPLSFKKYILKHDWLIDNKHNELDVIRRIQNRLQKIMVQAKLHQKTAKGLNIHTYEVHGPNKTTKIRGWLLPPSSLFGD
ncbi:MAG: MobH family relaxase, partial [Gammaproteobacteria bacterium]